MVKFLGFAFGELGSTTEKVEVVIVAVDEQVVIGFDLLSYRFSSDHLRSKLEYPWSNCAKEYPFGDKSSNQYYTFLNSLDLKWSVINNNNNK